MGSWIAGRTRSLGALARRAGRVSAETARGAFTHGITNTAGQFAYSALLATVPFLIALVSLVGLNATPGTYTRVVNTFQQEIPESLRSVLEVSIRKASASRDQAAVFLGLGLLMGLILMSNVVLTLIRGFNAAFELPDRPWLRGRLVALALAGVVALLAAATTLALVGGPPLVDAIAQYFGSGRTARRWADASLFWVAIAGFLATILLLFHAGPNTARRSWSGALPGSLIAVGAWLGLSRLFRLYVNRFGSLNPVYEVLGAAVIYMVFLYLTGFAILLGGEFNAAIARLRAAPAE